MLLGLVLFAEILDQGSTRIIPLVTWIVAGGVDVVWSLRLDTLSGVMIVAVTIVSAMVHVYSIGYMAHDAGIPRFMAYLSLFTFFMLPLVTANDFVQLFFGWEGVGLLSYLLIGFWYDRRSANDAAIKAFLVNRVGDFGFALGIFATFVIFGSLDFDTVFGKAPSAVGTTMNFLDWQVPSLTLACILLFIGAMGKSAQLGLHTWLPDAMEGPTPVSALIKRATRGTAGVYMVARLSPLFEYAPTALAVVGVIGGTTAVFAASVGMAQNDIKRVIAYSTCSQLGYMFFAAGVSAYGAAMFHLFTHAFFKALLFLGAGSVIHAMSAEQDMRRMGGLWNKIPYTYAVMWIGSLSLAGIPFFAGYYSKDTILALPGHGSIGAAEELTGIIEFLPLIAAALGIATAYLCYSIDPGIPARLTLQYRAIYLFLLNKWYFDELYDRLFVKSAFSLGDGLWKTGDGMIIDGLGPDGIAAATRELAREASRLQTGYVYHYAFAMLIGVVALVTWYLLPR